jgi:hypothetical protein
MASEKVKLEKGIFGGGVDAEVPSWEEFSKVRLKIKDIEKRTALSNQELQKDLQRTDYHLNKVIEGHNELQESVNQLDQQVTEQSELHQRLVSALDGLESRNLVEEIAPLIEGQVNRFYKVAQEIADHADKTKEWITRVSQELHKKYEVLDSKVTKSDADTAQVAESIASLKREADSIYEGFLRNVEIASSAHQKQLQCILNKIRTEATNQTTSCLESLTLRSKEILAKVTACSEQLERARKGTEEASNLLQKLQAPQSQNLKVVEGIQELSERSWKAFWRRLVWLFAGIPPKTD